MSLTHGASARQLATSVSTPVVATSGLAFIVGTAPVQTVGGKVNEPVLCYSYDEAVSALGYSGDWKKYTLCEAMYAYFKLYGVAPVVLVNVLDPALHKEEVAAKEMDIVDGRVLLPEEAMIDTVKAGDHVRGTDYELFYADGALVLEVLEDGGIQADAKLSVSYTAVKPEAVAASDIIGGYDVNTKAYSGLELLDQVFPRFSVVTDLVLAPGWSDNPGVAAVMAAKAEKINDVFLGKAVCDVPAGAVKHYTDVPAWKKTSGISLPSQVLCWPMVRMAGDDEDHPLMFHLSTHAAARMGATDTDNGGCPSESPSNKSLMIDGAVLADQSAVILDVPKANYLNDNGVVTALNFIGGYVLWGNATTCFPANTDVKDYFISVSRTMGWISNSLILTFWSQVDKKMNRRLIDSIVDSANIWFNGLTAEDKLLGARVEFRAEENSETALMAGRIVLHVFSTPPSPAQQIDFLVEYDVNYIKAALAA